jgi:hypothetical protein
MQSQTSMRPLSVCSTDHRGSSSILCTILQRYLFGSTHHYAAGGDAGNFSLAFFSLFQVHHRLTRIAIDRARAFATKNFALSAGANLEVCVRSSPARRAQVSTGDGWAWAIARPLIGNIYPNLVVDTVPINTTDERRSSAGPTPPSTAEPTIRRPVIIARFDRATEPVLMTASRLQSCS